MVKDNVANYSLSNASHAILEVCQRGPDHVFPFSLITASISTGPRGLDGETVTQQLPRVGNGIGSRTICRRVARVYPCSRKECEIVAGHVSQIATGALREAECQLCFNF